MKKTLVAIVLLVLAVAAGYHFYPAKKEEGQKNKSTSSRIRIGYNSEAVSSAATIVAYEKKFFSNHNLDPEMIPLKSGKEIAQAMSANQVDIGIGGVANFVPAMAKGAPVRFFAFSVSSPTYIFVRPDGNINNFSDLYGKTVSVTINGLNDLIFRIAMNQENIDTEKIKFADIERSYNVAALMDKKVIDAAVVSEQDTEMFQNAGAILLKQWEDQGYSKQTVPRNSLVINSDFLNQNEAVAENFLDAILDAHRLMKNNPQESAEVLAKHISEKSSGAINHAPEKIVEQWESNAITNVIWQDPAVSMELVKKMKEVGIIDKELSLPEVYNLRFESKLKAAQQEIYGQQD